MLDGPNDFARINFEWPNARPLAANNTMNCVQAEYVRQGSNGAINDN